MARIIHYRDKCIGCGICQEMQPSFWRMSKKDGKANLLQASIKKGIHQLVITESDIRSTEEVIKACPARIIKLG